MERNVLQVASSCDGGRNVQNSEENAGIEQNGHRHCLL